MDNNNNNNKKWLATVASIWIQCTSGASYCFAIYSSTLKSSQGYDQSTLDTVSVFKDIGANIGVLSGLLYHAVTQRQPGSRSFGSGLSLVYIAGAVQCFVGYFCMWLSVIGVIEKPHLLFMCLFMFMAAHAQTFFNTANVVVAVTNFPDYGGTSVGIMKWYVLSLVPMENSKWIATVASIWIQCSCGPSYAFGIYSAVLKSSQGYDQSTLDTVSVFKDIGANIGVLSGLLYHAVTYNKNGSSRWMSRFGSGLPLVYLAGAVQFFAGYFCLWLTVMGVIEKPHVLLVCFFMFMAAHAQTFYNTANIVVAVRNFPDYSGTTVGIMKGFLGLSGAILIQIYQMLFEGNPTTFLLMVAVFPTLVSLLLMSFVHVNPANTTNDKQHLNGFSIIAIIVAAYLMIIIIFQNTFTFPPWAHILTTIVLLIMVSSPLHVALKAKKDEQNTLSPSMTPLIVSSEALEDALVEMNLLQAVCTINFWLLFVPLVFAMGSGLATINNITQIGESLDYSTTEINTMVSLWSIWNFLGRFGGGFVSDYFLHKHGLGRPLFISLTQATMVLGHLIIGSGGNLYIASVIVGICYGSQWSLMPTITSEIFGVKHMGTIFNTIAAANPIGSYLFSVRVIGSIYDKETLVAVGSCHGIHCFMLSYYICAGACVFGFLISLVLFFRTRGFYSLILQSRLKKLEV